MRLAIIALALMLSLAGLWRLAYSADPQEDAMSDPSCDTACGLPASDEELRALLTPEQYRIMKENGTERPFANEYWDNHAAGLYVDRISGTPLFASSHKFDSGTGWPSFTRPVQEGTIVELEDRSHGMRRIEVRSASSDSHLGHVFPDGPAPSRLRYCINSASLRFIPVDQLEAEGFAQWLPLFGALPSEPGTDPVAIPGVTELATFGGGCFWGVETFFRDVRGVVATAVGYAGGTTEKPTYEEVCRKTTGHAEVVQLAYDPKTVSYETLLRTFFEYHDPTQLNRQGPDVGSQYRSVIFTHTPEQAEGAARYIAELTSRGVFSRPIVTQVQAAPVFWRGEEYHQQYFAKRGAVSCHPRQREL